MKCKYCDSEDAELVIDPYCSELYGEYDEVPLCGDCVETRRDDI